MFGTERRFTCRTERLATLTLLAHSQPCPKTWQQNQNNQASLLIFPIAKAYLGRKPCIAISSWQGWRQQYSTTDPAPIQRCCHRLYGELFCIDTSVVKTASMQCALLEHVLISLWHFQTILHNQIIFCELMAGSVIMQRCLTIDTIAILPLHKVLLHAKTLCSLCSKNSKRYRGSFKK